MMYKNILNDIFVQEIFFRTLLYLIPFLLIFTLNLIKKDFLVFKVLKKIIYIVMTCIFILLALDRSYLEKILK